MVLLPGRPYPIMSADGNVFGMMKQSIGDCSMKIYYGSLDNPTLKYQGYTYDSFLACVSNKRRDFWIGYSAGDGGEEYDPILWTMKRSKDKTFLYTFYTDPEIIDRFLIKAQMNAF
jgi:hypothetical protein